MKEHFTKDDLCCLILKRRYPIFRAKRQTKSQFHSRWILIRQINLYLHFFLLQSQLVEPGKTSRLVTVAILLPTQIEKGQYDVKVLDGGQGLELNVQFPKTLWDLSMLHIK